MLAQDLHRDRALPGDHVRVVERVHEREVLRLLQLERMGVGLVEALAVEHGLATQRAHRGDLQLGRDHGHHDHGPRAQHARAERDPLGVVPGRGRDHSFREQVRREACELVVGAANLEAEDRLLVLALQQQLVAEPRRQLGGVVERRLGRDVVDARGEDALEVVGVRHGLTVAGTA